MLTGVELRDIQSLRTALRILHLDHQVPHVVISSIPVGHFLESELVGAGLIPPRLQEADSDDDAGSSPARLLCLTSSLRPQPTPLTPNSTTAWISDVHVAVFPKIQGYFSGVGDLFSALVLGHFTPSARASEGASDPQPTPAKGAVDEITAINEALCTATSLALSTTQAILVRTNAYSSTLPQSECPSTDDEEDKADPMRRVRRSKARELRIVQGLDDILRPTRSVELTRWDAFWEAKAETFMK